MEWLSNAVVHLITIVKSGVHVVLGIITLAEPLHDLTGLIKFHVCTLLSVL